MEKRGIYIKTSIIYSVLFFFSCSSEKAEKVQNIKQQEDMKSETLVNTLKNIQDRRSIYPGMGLGKALEILSENGYCIDTTRVELTGHDETNEPLSTKRRYSESKNMTVDIAYDDSGVIVYLRHCKGDHVRWPTDCKRQSKVQIAPGEACREAPHPMFRGKTRQKKTGE